MLEVHALLRSHQRSRREGGGALFEFHGWASVWVSSNPDDIDTQTDADVKAVLDVLRERIRKIEASNVVHDLRYQNGLPFLWTSGFTNHRDSRIDDLFALFTLIAEVAPGSYGLLHYRDDEDRDGKGIANDFRVLVLKKGSLTDERDPFLSPFVPDVEDAGS